jgi:hypothetical protein
MVEKILSTSCVGLLLAAMSALNEEFRHKLVELAHGGLMNEASAFSSRAMRWTSGMMDSVGAYGGDHNWLLVTALVGAVVGAVWFLKW